MKKNIKQYNWEKIGVYIAVITLIMMFASKLMDVSERISYMEGKLAHLEEKK